MTILISLAWTLVVIGVVKAVFGYRLPGLALAVIYLAPYWLVQR